MKMFCYYYFVQADLFGRQTWIKISHLSTKDIRIKREISVKHSLGMDWLIHLFSSQQIVFQLEKLHTLGLKAHAADWAPQKKLANDAPEGSAEHSSKDLPPEYGGNLCSNGWRWDCTACTVLNDTIYSISQKWLHLSHFSKYFIISFHGTTPGTTSVQLV